MGIFAINTSPLSLSSLPDVLLLRPRQIGEEVSTPPVGAVQAVIDLLLQAPIPLLRHVLPVEAKTFSSNTGDYIMIPRTSPQISKAPRIGSGYMVWRRR